MRKKQPFKNLHLLNLLERRRQYRRYHCVIVLPFREYLKMQIKIMHSDVNIWLTGIKLGRKPTLREAELHFVENGGAKIFARNYTYIK